jgi:predicted nucleotidyltransferase
MAHGGIHEAFTAALDALTEQVKHDKSVLAAVLCGSLSHDTVWAKSDIDLVFVTVDDKPAPSSGLAIESHGVNVHALLIPRTAFRKIVEGSTDDLFMRSFLAKGRLVYTHDPTIETLLASLQEVGERDTQIQLLRAATHALPAVDKARKWFVTRKDLEYSAVWILAAANGLARMEVIGQRLIPDREVLPQAMALNPAFFKPIYVDLLNAKKTPKAVEAALDAIDRYIADRASSLFAAVIDYLREAGDTRSCSEIEHHFTRNLDVSGVTIACEYLADRGLIGKASTPARLTPKSNVQVQELAFFYVETQRRG